MHKEKSKNWPRLTDYATFLMNNREGGKTRYSPSDIFFCRPMWRLEMPFVHAGNQDVESWIQEQNRLAQTVQDQLRRKRTTRHKYLNRKITAAKYLVKDYVLVHRNRFRGRTARENENTLFYGALLGYWRDRRRHHSALFTNARRRSQCGAQVPQAVAVLTQRES